MYLQFTLALFMWSYRRYILKVLLHDFCCYVMLCYVMLCYVMLKTDAFRWANFRAGEGWVVVGHGGTSVSKRLIGRWVRVKCVVVSCITTNSKNILKREIE